MQILDGRPVHGNIGHHEVGDGEVFAPSQFLAALAEARPKIPLDRIAIVVAHPDDETMGCGAQIARLIGATIIIVTDGAPHDLVDARNYGFENSADYALAPVNSNGR
jgi:hypothetical protein